MDLLPSGYYVDTMCFSVYVYVHFHILLHYYGIMDLIILEMHSLFDGMADLPLPPKDGPIYEAIKDNFKAKIKRIVKWHNSVYEYVRVPT